LARPIANKLVAVDVQGLDRIERPHRRGARQLGESAELAEQGTARASGERDGAVERLDDDLDLAGEQQEGGVAHVALADQQLAGGEMHQRAALDQPGDRRRGEMREARMRAHQLDDGCLVGAIHRGLGANSAPANSIGLGRFIERSRAMATTAAFDEGADVITRDDETGRTTPIATARSESFR